MTAKLVSLVGAVAAAFLSACTKPTPPEQVSGFNGPEIQRSEVFRSESELRNSWVAEALSQGQLSEFIGDVDFSRNVVVGFAFGARPNASGSVSIGELKYDDNMPGYYVYVEIGVVPESCGVPFAESYPFVLAIAPAHPDAELTGYFAQNFGDGCGPIIHAQPTALPDGAATH